MKRTFRLALLATALAAACGAQAQTSPAPRGAPAPAATPDPAAGVISNPDIEKAGTLSAQAWLALLDRKDWGTAWDTSSTLFHQAVPLGNWMDAIPKVRDAFGPLVEREVAQAIYKKTLPGKPDGDYVSVLFNSKFQKQSVQEVVTTVRDTDGRWRVTGYQPQPQPK
jgi:hypothetical protein